MQFAANDPWTFARAAELAAPHCDAVELNLGCPQREARLGHFGCYLIEREDWDLVASMVRAAVEATAGSPLRVYCKIRLCRTLEDTLARRLFQTGAPAPSQAFCSESAKRVAQK